MHYHWRQTAPKNSVAFIRTTAERFTQPFLNLVNLRDLFDVGTKLYSSIFKVLYSKLYSKYIQEQQPNEFDCYNQDMGFVKKNRPERGQVQDWYPNEKIVVVPIGLNGKCCSLCRYRIILTKMKAISFCLFQLFNAIFCFQYNFSEYSKEGRLSSSHAEISNFPSDVCYNDT